MLLPKDEQIAKVLEQRNARFHDGFVRQRIPSRHLHLLDVIEVFGQFSPLIREHEKDERRIETGNVLLGQVFHVDQFDEIDEEVDLEKERNNIPL